MSVTNSVQYKFHPTTLVCFFLFYHNFNPLFKISFTGSSQTFYSAPQCLSNMFVICFHEQNNFSKTFKIILRTFLVIYLCRK